VPSRQRTRRRIASVTLLPKTTVIAGSPEAAIPRETGPEDLDALPPEPVLAEYQGRIFYSLAAVAALVLLPFAINNFLQGRFWLGVATSLAVTSFFLNAYATYRERPVPVPPVLIFLPAVIALLMSVQRQGLVGVLWTYPSMVLFHFVLGRRLANAFNVVLLLTVTPLAYRFAGTLLTVRIFATLALTIVFTNIFSAIVGGLQRRLHELAIRDPLTGALNRRQLAPSLDLAIERWRRSGVPAALVTLDLDHFKRINDERGHAEGDRVLVRVVLTLRSRLRKVDLLFRSGGEEFLLLLTDTDANGAVTLAEGLRAAIAAAPLLDDRAVTASLGVASLDPADDAESWLRRGDRALYAAKAAGRNRVEIAPPAGS
jgi:diguanylate cyclase (GGDEF)-like protein